MTEKKDMCMVINSIKEMEMRFESTRNLTFIYISANDIIIATEPWNQFNSIIIKQNNSQCLGGHKRIQTFKCCFFLFPVLRIILSRRCRQTWNKWSARQQRQKKPLRVRYLDFRYWNQVMKAFTWTFWSCL